jgi:hypothetical protein
MTKIVILSAWLGVANLLISSHSFSLELVFKDPQYSFQTLRALSYAVSGPADIQCQDS